MFLYDFLPWKKSSSSSIIEHRLFLQDGNYYLNLWKIIKEKFYNYINIFIDKFIGKKNVKENTTIQ